MSAISPRCRRRARALTDGVPPPTTAFAADSLRRPSRPSAQAFSFHSTIAATRQFARDAAEVLPLLPGEPTDVMAVWGSLGSDRIQAALVRASRPVRAIIGTAFNLLFFYYVTQLALELVGVLPPASGATAAAGVANVDAANAWAARGLEAVGLF